MMRMARIMLTMVLVTAVVLPLTADDKPAKRPQLSPAAQAMMRMQSLHKALEEIKLTDEQQAEVKKLHEELGPKLKEAFDKLGAILTDEQKEKAEAAAKAAKEAGKEGRAFFLAVQSSVELSDEQQTKLDAVGKEMLEFQRGVVKQSMAILTAEQKQELQAKLAPAGGKQGKKKAE